MTPQDPVLGTSPSSGERIVKALADGKYSLAEIQAHIDPDDLYMTRQGFLDSPVCYRRQHVSTGLQIHRLHLPSIGDDQALQTV